VVEDRRLRLRPVGRGPRRRTHRVRLGPAGWFHFVPAGPAGVANAREIGSQESRLGDEA
jgi:hypothetical protein